MTTCIGRGLVTSRARYTHRPAIPRNGDAKGGFGFHSMHDDVAAGGISANSAVAGHYVTIPADGRHATSRPLPNEVAQGEPMAGCASNDALATTKAATDVVLVLADERSERERVSDELRRSGVPVIALGHGDHVLPVLKQFLPVAVVLRFDTSSPVEAWRECDTIRAVSPTALVLS